MQTVVLHNQASNPSKKIIKHIGKYQAFLQLEYVCNMLQQCKLNHRFKICFGHDAKICSSQPNLKPFQEYHQNQWKYPAFCS